MLLFYSIRWCNAVFLSSGAGILLQIQSEPLCTYVLGVTPVLMQNFNTISFKFLHTVIYNKLVLIYNDGTFVVTTAVFSNTYVITHHLPFHCRQKFPVRHSAYRSTFKLCMYLMYMVVWILTPICEAIERVVSPNLNHEIMLWSIWFENVFHNGWDYAI
jgi:hypothetical protein